MLSYPQSCATMPKKMPSPTRVQEVAYIMVSNPNLTITQAMHATGQYSKQEYKHRGLKMAVQCHCNKIIWTERPPIYTVHPAANLHNKTVISGLVPSTSTKSQTLMPEYFMASNSASTDANLAAVLMMSKFFLVHLGSMIKIE